MVRSRRLKDPRSVAHLAARGVQVGERCYRLLAPECHLCEPARTSASLDTVPSHSKMAKPLRHKGSPNARSMLSAVIECHAMISARGTNSGTRGTKLGTGFAVEMCSMPPGGTVGPAVFRRLRGAPRCPGVGRRVAISPGIKRKPSAPQQLD